MLTTSSDILNLALATCVTLLTIFLCWAIYYFIASAQKIHNIVRRLETGVIKAEEVVDIVRGKLKNSGAYLMVLGEVARKALEFVKERNTKKTTANKKNK